MAQTVKNPPAMWETWVQSPGWEHTLEEDMATHSSILPWRIPDRGYWQAACSPWGRKESDTTEQLSTEQYWLLQPGIGINLGPTNLFIYLSIYPFVYPSVYLCIYHPFI